MNEIQQEELNKLLFYAVLCNKLEKVEKLIKSGANINAVNQYGITPLHYAARGGYEKIVELLLASGANINAVDEHGSSPLHLAATMQDKVVELLLANEADINVVDKDGNTALDLIVSPLRFRFLHLDEQRYPLTLSQLVPLTGFREKVVELLVNYITKLEAAGLYVSEKNLQGKNEFINTSNDRRDNYLQHFQSCKEEIKKIEKESKPLYDFLRESNDDSLVSIWKKNENVRSKFGNQESLQAQYPEYVDILINKANKVEKEIFLHNNKPLIDALPQLGYHGSGVLDKIKAFLKENRARFGVKCVDPKKSLIDFVDFEDNTTLRIPKLKLCLAALEVVKNNTPNTSLNNLNTERSQAIGQAL